MINSANSVPKFKKVSPFPQIYLIEEKTKLSHKLNSHLKGYW